MYLVDSLSVNYTRLYALDGRELLAEVNPVYRDWPGQFTVMRSPWEGIGGFGEDRGDYSFGRDDFALLVEDPKRVDSSASLGACIAVARVAYPHHLDEDLLGEARAYSNKLHPDRTVRPWIRPEAYLGNCQSPFSESNVPAFAFDSSTKHTVSALIRNPKDEMFLDVLADDVTDNVGITRQYLVALASAGDVGSPGGSSMPGTMDDIVLFTGQESNGVLIELARGPLAGPADLQRSVNGALTDEQDMGIAVGVHPLLR